jgi:hypothetical protein
MYSYGTLFRDFPTLFEDYFIIDKFNTTIMVTPNYQDFGFLLLSGRTGNIIGRSDTAGLDSSMCILELVELNSTHGEIMASQTKFVLLCANVSRSRLMGSDKLSKGLYRIIPEFSIKGLSLDPFIYNWEKNSNNLDFNDMVPLPSEFLAGYGTGYSGNTSLEYASSLSIEGSGENFILRFSASNATIKDPIENIMKWAAIHGLQRNQWC